MSRNDPIAKANSSWLARAYHTPVGDAIRGNLSARLDLRAAIAGFDLPTSLAGLVLSVTHNTRLWRREKVDVARELAAHFTDGLTSGRAADQLARDFGDPRRAAQLIRRAKRRNRPWPWQVWHYSLRALLSVIGVSLLVYAAITARFYWGQPTIRHNYWEEINEARRVPESDRAWPVYRDTLFELGNKEAHARAIHNHAMFGPKSPYWDQVVAWVDRHQDAIDALRRATARPRLGFYLGDAADLAAAKEHEGFWMVPKTMSLVQDNADVISALLYGPQEMRTIARILVADANVAASREDGARATADVAALVALAEQQRDEPRATLVEQLVGIAIFSIATDTLGQLFVESPAIFGDALLVALAHRLASYQRGESGADLSAETMLFEDVLQRAYTDDGRGDGRITFDGFKTLDEYSAGDLLRIGFVARSPDLRARLIAGALCPALSTLVGRRAEASAEYYELMDEMIANHQGPSWQWDRDKIEAAEDRLNELTSGFNKPRYVVINMLFPAMSAVYSATERSLQQRDAAEAVTALQLWQRRHGAWPERLDQLVPDLLPEVPRDRMDGQPLRYVVRDGRPLLYSIGGDWRDDGGTTNAEDPKAVPHRYGPPPAKREFDPSNPAGDLILWPPIPEKEEDDETPSATPPTDG
jgi:hypothetical protein